MEYIRVTKDNIENEHICCAIANNNDIQVKSKKNWLTDRFADGLVFVKSKEEAQNDPTPLTTYALFHNGRYLTNEQMNDKHFLKLLDF